MKGCILTAKTISDFERHLQDDEKSAATIEKYIRDIRVFSAYVTDAEITKEIVVAYKAKLIEEQYAVRSINSMSTSINSLFAFLN